MKIEKHHYYLFILGMVWSFWLKAVPALTIHFGVTTYGPSAFMVYLTGSIGDFLNVSLASLLLVLAVALTGLRDLRWWEIYIAVTPGFVWAMFDLHTRFLPLGGETIMTLCYFAALLIMPPLMMWLIGKLMNLRAVSAIHGGWSNRIKIERRHFFLLFVGVLWEPWLIQIAVWIGQIDVFEYGDTMYAIRSTAIVGDFINVSLASIALGLLIVLSGVRLVHWWEVFVVVLPSFVWTAFDFSRLFLVTGSIGATEAVYVLALFIMPLFMTQLIGMLINGRKTTMAS